VFELENDNHDIKFISRVRISPEDFNQDLLILCFSFLTPENTVTLCRVSKQWNKLIKKSNMLWKDYCTRFFKISELSEDWYAQFVFCNSLYSAPHFIPKWMPEGSYLKKHSAIRVCAGLYILSQSNHCTFRIDEIHDQPEKIKGFESYVPMKPYMGMGGGLGIKKFTKMGLGGPTQQQQDQPNPLCIMFGLMPKKLVSDELYKISMQMNINYSNLLFNHPACLDGGYYWNGMYGTLTCPKVSYMPYGKSTSTSGTFQFKNNI
jgi:hypothetical protein